jgi:hypothetical protein
LDIYVRDLLPSGSSFLITFNAAIVFVGLAPTLSPTFGMIGFVVVPIAFVCALTPHLMGTHFNIPDDRLSYPYFAWRLGLALSGIHDANAQIINKRGVDVLASWAKRIQNTKPCATTT